MADQAQLLEALRNADKAGDHAAATRIAQLLRDTTSPKEIPKQVADATESPTSLRNLAGAAIEPSLAMASSGILAPISGLAGVASAPFVGTDKAADVVNAVKGVAYEPRTEGGKNAMTALGAPGEVLSKIGPALMEFGIQDPEMAGFEDFTNPTVGTVTPGVATGIQTATEGAASIAGAKGAPKLAPKGGVLPRGSSPQARMLGDKGVTMTPGQARGGILNTIEQAATSIPVIGDIIKGARGKSVEQFSQATVNDALKDIKQTLPQGLKGNDAIRHAGNAFDDAYNKILPKLSGDLDSIPPTGSMLPVRKGQRAPGQSLRNELDSLKQMANQGLPPAQAAEVARIIDQEITAKFTSSGKASGATLQEIRESLRTEADTYRRSTTPADRKVALAIDTAKAAIDSMIERVNPQHAAEYKAIGNGYAKFKVAETAGSYKGTKEGVATPSQYKGAVRAQDRSKGKRKFAQGRALQQPLAKAGEKVLKGDVVPDSGTPARIATMELLGGGSAATAMLHNPAFLLGSGLVPLLYSQYGLKALQPFLLGTKSLARPAASAMALGATQSPVNRIDQAGVAQP
jgi:hypothetical protein